MHTFATFDTQNPLIQLKHQCKKHIGTMLEESMSQHHANHEFPRCKIEFEHATATEKNEKWRVVDYFNWNGTRELKERNRKALKFAYFTFWNAQTHAWFKIEIEDFERIEKENHSNIRSILANETCCILMRVYTIYCHIK